jgi:hypothetical protein
MIIEFWKTNENAITCYKSRPNRSGETNSPSKVKTRKGATIKKPITVESPDGEKEEYKSVFDASKAVGMNYSTLCAFLNGRAKNPTEYKIYKSTLNN